MNAPGCRSIQLSCVRSDMFQSICIYPPCYIRVAISALRRGLGTGRGMPRAFYEAQTASSQPSRMHFGTDSTCICFPHSGLGVWGHAGPLHGDLGTHKPLRHNLHECVSALILNAFGPAHSGLGAWGHVGLSHGGLHKPLRHNPHECISARILNASGPRARVWGV